MKLNLIYPISVSIVVLIYHQKMKGLIWKESLPKTSLQRIEKLYDDQKLVDFIKNPSIEELKQRNS